MGSFTPQQATFTVPATLFEDCTELADVSEVGTAA